MTKTKLFALQTLAAAAGIALIKGSYELGKMLGTKLAEDKEAKENQKTK